MPELKMIDEDGDVFKIKLEDDNSSLISIVQDGKTKMVSLSEDQNKELCMFIASHFVKMEKDEK